MTRFLLLFLLLLFLVRFVWRLLGGIVQGAMSAGPAQPQGGSRSPAPSAVKMARDPVCGTYVVPGKALEFVRGRETLYFCSDKCREQYKLAN
jgi:YHS domain-containing protein